MEFSKESVAEFQHLFVLAEDAIKKTERFSGEISVSAINELRYAGAHFVEAIQKLDRENLNAACRHCIRARYDTYEAMVVFLLENIASFLGAHYPAQALDEKLPAWRDYRKLFIDGREKLQNLRAVKFLSEEDLRELEILCGELNMARVAIDSVCGDIDDDREKLREKEYQESLKFEREKENIREKRDDQRFLITLIFAVLSVLLALSSLWCYKVAVILIAIIVLVVVLSNKRRRFYKR